MSTHDFSLNGEWHVTGTQAEWAITYLEWAITYLYRVGHHMLPAYRRVGHHVPGVGHYLPVQSGPSHVTSTQAEWAITYLEWVITACTEWAITYLDVEHERGYSHVVFTLHLKRRYKFYVMNIVLPCVMLSILILIGFCLPPDAGEKISLGISVLLAFTVFLVMIADSIPRVSSAIPLIGKHASFDCPFTVVMRLKNEQVVKEF